MCKVTQSYKPSDSLKIGAGYKSPPCRRCWSTITLSDRPTHSWKRLSHRSYNCLDLLPVCWICKWLAESTHGWHTSSSQQHETFITTKLYTTITNTTTSPHR